MEYYWEKSGKNAQNIKALTYPLYTLPVQTLFSWKNS